MSFTSIILSYLWWHYTTALVRFTSIYRDIVSFVFDFFSLKVLLKSFVAPWRRLGEEYPKSFFDFTETLSVFVINTLMRIVGMFVRLILIIIGVLVLIIACLFYPLLFLCWLVLPVAILLFFLSGLKLLFF